MTIRAFVLALASLLFVAATNAQAHEAQGNAHAKGIVNSVDVGAHKVNMSHEAISALGWPAMKMDFPVSASVDLKSIQAGTQVEFTIEKNKSGAFEIQSIKPVSPK